MCTLYNSPPIKISSNSFKAFQLFNTLYYMLTICVSFMKVGLTEHIIDIKRMTCC